MTKKKLTAAQKYSRATIKVRRRLKRIEGKPGYKSIVEKYRGEFPTLRELGNVSDKDLMIMTRKAEGLLKTKTLTHKHEEQIVKALKTLNETGFDYINKENFDYYFSFLDDARARGLASIYGYQPILDAINRAETKGLTAEEIAGNIEYWGEHAKGQKLYVRKGRKPKSSSHDFKR